MAYQIQDLGHSLLVVTNREFEIWARSPYVGDVAFDIYVGELKGSEQFMDLAFGEIEKLAEKLEIKAPSRYPSARHIAFHWVIAPRHVRLVLRELAELFDSTEFVEAVAH